MNNIKTYKIFLTCRNCGDTFNKEIPFGVDVTDSDQFLSFKFECKAGKEKIKCTACGSTRVSKLFGD